VEVPHPTFGQRIHISPVIAQRMATMNVPTAAVLRYANLPPDMFTSSTTMSAAQWLALWQALGACIDDPEFGLKAAQALAGEPQDVLTITALAAATLHAALVKVAKYKRVFAFEDLTMVNAGDTCTLRVDATLPDTALPHFLVDLTFAHLIELGRRGTGAEIIPLAVRLRRPEAHRGLYEQFFRCPVDFEAHFDELVLSEHDTRRPLVTSNAVLNSYLEQGLENEISPRSFRDEVAALLKVRIAGKCPTALQVAREMGVSARTLRRRLQDNDSSFQDVLMAVRHDLARTYLREPAFGLKEISFLVGFEEVSSFQRAFRDWEGCPPGAWREAVRPPNRSAPLL